MAFRTHWEKWKKLRHPDRFARVRATAHRHAHTATRNQIDKPLAYTHAPAVQTVLIHLRGWTELGGVETQCRAT